MTMNESQWFEARELSGRTTSGGNFFAATLIQTNYKSTRIHSILINYDIKSTKEESQWHEARGLSGRTTSGGAFFAATLNHEIKRTIKESQWRIRKPIFFCIN